MIVSGNSFFTSTLPLIKFELFEKFGYYKNFNKVLIT